MMERRGRLFWRVLIAFAVGLLLAWLLGKGLLAALGAEPDQPRMFQHPAAGSADPYRGYNFVDQAGDSRGSCCGGSDCRPVPYDPTTGMMQLPDGRVVDPRTFTNLDGSSPTIYWSSGLGGSYAEQAHACVHKGHVRCFFLPGAGA